MDRNRRRILGLVAVGAAVFGLLLVIAAGAGQAPGTTRSLTLGWSLDVGKIIQAVIGVAIIAAILLPLLLGRREEREKGARRRKRKPRSNLGVILVVLTAIAFLLLFRASTRPLGEEAAEPTNINISEVDFLATDDLGGLWPMLLLVAGAVLVVAAVHWLSREPAEEETDADPGELVAGSLSDALARLEWSDDPRSVIIKAYSDIEAALGDAGMPRSNAEAPREYLARVLDTLAVDAAAATRLTQLFELARYSDRSLGEIDKDEATAALRHALDSLTTPVG